MKTFKTFLVPSVLLAITAFVSACDSTTELQISSVGDTMAFDKTTLTAKAGGKVKLTLKNGATSPAMQHDWVLVKPGTEADVANAGMAAGPGKDYIAESANVLAHTKLTKPGESDTIEFTAPATAGDYPYICTFPGHYALMKGVLHVE
ncbi:MAG: plastocyanin/azurin family copper-binding protein [Bdellovibrionota bacterium]